MSEHGFLDRPSTNDSGYVGSFFDAKILGNVRAAGVLSHQQILQKYNITPKEYRAIVERLNNTTVLDALFSWPDGRFYDILLHMVAHCR